MISRRGDGVKALPKAMADLLKYVWKTTKDVWKTTTKHLLIS
jgi:hypothetical protein